MQILNLVVVWHPDFTPGLEVAEAVAQTFDSLGMVRGGVRLSVPVRAVSASWPGEGGPRFPEAAHAAVTGVIYVSERRLVRAARGEWIPFFDSMTTLREEWGPALFEIVLPADGYGLELPPAKTLHAKRGYSGLLNNMTEPVKRRMMIGLMREIGAALKRFERIQRQDAPNENTDLEPVFISYARGDGSEIAQWFFEHLHSPELALNTWLDVRSLRASSSFRSGILQAVARSSLLAIETKSYTTRPYCQLEFTEAKRHGRAIVKISPHRDAEDWVFPYAGNVVCRPLRMPDGEDGWREIPEREADRRTGGAPMLEQTETEKAVRSLLSEVLRCQIWRMKANIAIENAGLMDALPLPRPPELVDLANLRLVRKSGTPLPTIIYPDPPVDQVERTLLLAVEPKLKIRALSEVA